MGSKSLFNRGDGEDDQPTPPPEQNEGVRLIDPDEAAEVAERGSARRRGGDTPRYGDRPESPQGPKPALRFPLADSEDVGDISRPKMRPTSGAAASRRPEAEPTETAATAPADPAPRPERSEPAPRRPQGPPALRTLEDIEREAAEQARRLDDASPASSSPPDKPPTAEPLTVEPASDEVVMPHWTTPATGEVPKVLISDDEPDDAARWAAFASGPRWRDENDRTGATDFDDLAHDDESRIGALDTDGLTTEQIISFDDLDVPVAEQPTRSSSAAQGEAPGEPRPHRQPERARRTIGSGTQGGPRGGTSPPEPPAPPTPPGGTSGRNMPQAAAVGAGLTAVALFLAWLGPGWFLVLIEVAVVLAAIEYFSGLRRGGYNPPTLLGLVAIAALPLAAFYRGDAAIPLVLFLLVAFGMVWYLTGVGGGDPIRNLGATMLAVCHVGVLGAFGALLLQVGPVGGATTAQGVSFIVMAAFAAHFYDLGGFFVGRRFGRTPISSASPNKTREGMLGGMAAAIVIVVVLSIIGLTEFSLLQALLFGFFCAVAAFVGDLSESLIKRDLGIKDMGSLLPGHGGVLDRFDGLLFVLPTAYYTVRVFFS